MSDIINIDQMNSYEKTIYYNAIIEKHAENIRELTENSSEDKTVSNIVYSILIAQEKIAMREATALKKENFVHVDIQACIYDLIKDANSNNQKLIEKNLNDLDRAFKNNLQIENITEENIKESNEKIISILYRDAQECMLDILAPDDSREELYNDPAFQNVKGTTFFSFCKMSKDLLNTENVKRLDTIIEQRLYPILNLD